MAQPGEVIEHPSFGTCIKFLETAEQTRGELLRVEVTLPPGFSMPEHEERHEVLSGTLRARVGGKERDYNAGERVVGPPGVPHAWRNPSDQAILRLVSEHRPVLHMELMLEAGSRILRDFSNDKKALPKHLLRAAVVLSEIRSDFYFTSWSLRAMMAALVALAPAGRWLGYQADGR
jgi:quercetin dioxygenase-like cupin family protein